jgi:hypothetical protein
MKNEVYDRVLILFTLIIAVGASIISFNALSGKLLEAIILEIKSLD